LTAVSRASHQGSGEAGDIGADHGKFVADPLTNSDFVFEAAVESEAVKAEVEAAA
jgi:hypothetical protein